MRKKTFQIDIPEPCDQKWSAMTPQGADSRFCSECERTIVDYTNKTDREIAAAYKKSGGKLCGRFQQNQLKRDFDLKTKVSSRPKLKAAGVMLSGLLLTSNVNAQTQKPNPIPTEQGQQEQTAKNVLHKDGKITITGTIKDERGEPLIGANIIIKGTTKGATTDIDGNFTLSLIPPRVLEISYTGYVTQHFEVVEGRLDYEIILKEGEINEEILIIAGIVRVEDYRDRTLYNWVRHKIDRLSYNIRDSYQAWKEIRAVNKVARQQEKQQKAITKEEVLLTEISIPSKLITKVYPNPFNTDIIVDINSSEEEELLFILSNEVGRQVFEQKVVVVKGSNQVQLDLTYSAYKTGTYFLSVLREGEVIQTETLIKVAE